MQIAGPVLLASVILESLIEAIKPALAPVQRWLDSHSNPDNPVTVFMYLSLLGGIAICLTYQIDGVALAGLGAETGSVFGRLLTGLVVGRASNLAHDALSGINGLAHKAQA